MSDQIWVLLPFLPLNFASTEVLFLSDLDRQVVSSRILVSLGYLLVHSFASTMLLYFSVVLRMSYPYGTYVPVSQSSLVFSMKLMNVEFGTDNRSLKMCLT